MLKTAWPRGVGPRAQTFIEYILLFGIVTAILVAMSPMIRRFTQGMVKLTADQIGAQRLSDQQGGDSGYLVNVDIRSYDEQRSGREDRLGTTTYYPYARSERTSEQWSNLGKSE